MNTGPLLVMLASSLWALDALIRTGLTRSIPPAGIVFWEHVFGFFFLFPVFVRSLPALRKLPAAVWAGAIALALVSGVGGTLLFTQALGTSFATGDFVTPLLLQKTQPIFVTFLAAIFLREALSLRFLLLVPIALIGSYMVSFGVQPLRLELAGKELVVLLSLGASAAWGSGTILSKTLLTKLSFPQATSLRFALTIPVAFSASVVLGQTFPPSSFVPQQLVRFLLIALTTGGGATLVYYAGLARTRANVATFAELMFPIVSILIAVTPLNPYGSPQALSLANIFGITILLTAIILMSRGEKGDTVGNGKVVGTVIAGHGDGKKLGFPAANLALSAPLNLPYGVYAVRVLVGGKRRDGVLHWGPRVVFGEEKPQFEVHLFDFSGDLYGQKMDVQVIGFIRPSRNFSSLVKLIAQIRQDCTRTRQVLRRYGRPG